MTEHNLTPEQRERIGLLCDDLESDQHEQAFGKLEIIDESGNSSWCCLGRGSRVALDHGCQVTYDTATYCPDSGPEGEVGFYGDSDETMPREVYTWFGFAEGNPKVIADDGLEYFAAVLNDTGDHAGESYDLPRIGRAFRRTYLGDEDE